MKIEFNDHWELRQFCRDYIKAETASETADLSRRLEAEQDKVADLQRRLNKPPEPCGAEMKEVLFALARDYPEVLREILRKMLPESKIGQIKMVRTLFGVGLKEAKDFVDATTFALVGFSW